MLNTIPIVTMNKRATEYIQKEMWKDFKHFPTKKTTKHKRRHNTENQGQKKSYKAYRKEAAKWQKLFPISIYFKCKWIKLSNPKTETGWMDKNTWFNYMLSIRDSL